MANTNKTLESLKSIHQMQKEGTILEFLRDIRGLKTQLDDFSKRAGVRKQTLKEVAAKLEEKPVEKPEIKEETAQKVVETPKVVEKPTSSFDNEKKPASNTNSYKKFDNTQPRQFSQNGQRPNFQGQRQNYQGNRPNFQGNSNYQGNRQNMNGQNRPNFQGQRPNFQRPGQNGRPAFPGKPGEKNTSFVSTKANNFKSFEIPDTNIQQPERNHGNKNKTPDRNKVIEERKTNIRKVDNRKNTFISYDDGFEETTMGSRKIANPKNKKKEETIVAPSVTHIVMTSKSISVKDLSEKTGKPVSELVKQLMILGIMATINSNIDYDAAELVCGELGITVELKLDKTMEEKLIDMSTEKEEDKENLVKRPPVVAVMGHVDHGKTSLLDAFRKTNVVSSEAGGITQKIGAYQISFNNEKITFIDTPGHAAFTAMRARGAKATDIAILVVAADDGIMPQTIEAINHIKAANIPMIVAINKMDKPEANPDRIKQQLAENGVLPEEWGGSTIVVPISAKTGMGLDQLKETILLVAEMEELKANPKRKATGVVIEAELDKNKGPVATVLVQNGTLKVGDSIMSGITFGKVRAMFDEHGKPVKAARPSTPVAVLGLNEVPSSGDNVYAVEESLSKQVIQERIAKIKEERAAQTSGVTLDGFMDRVHEGALKTLNLIIKADTQGSVEALKSTLLTLRNEEAKVNIVHSAAGAVTESDVILAETTKSVIIAFNQKAVGKAKTLADNLKVEIKEYKIIYEIVDDVTAALTGMLTVKYEEKYIGMAEIRMVFKLSTAGKVAGCYVRDGKITRNCIAKVKRGKDEIGTSTVESLKIVKDEKAEVAKGFECGVKLRDNLDIKEGDEIEFFVKEAIKRG